MKMIRGVVGRLGGGRCTLGFVVMGRRGILRGMWVSWGSWEESLSGNTIVDHMFAAAVEDMAEAIFGAADLAVEYPVVEHPSL